MEFETVKEALKELININQATKIITRKENGKSREITVKELQEINFETLVNVCDLLGMKELYLGEN